MFFRLATAQRPWKPGNSLIYEQKNYWSKNLQISSGHGFTGLNAPFPILPTELSTGFGDSFSTAWRRGQNQRRCTRFFCLHPQQILFRGENSAHGGKPLCGGRVCAAGRGSRGLVVYCAMRGTARGCWGLAIAPALIHNTTHSCWGQLVGLTAHRGLAGATGR